MGRAARRESIATRAWGPFPRTRGRISSHQDRKPCKQKPPNPPKTRPPPITRQPEEEGDVAVPPHIGAAVEGQHAALGHQVVHVAGGV